MPPNKVAVQARLARRTFLGSGAGVIAATVAGPQLAQEFPATAATSRVKGKEFNLPADLVKDGMCCSGLVDLKPVRLSARSSYVKFTDEIEQALSSQRPPGNLNAPLVVAYGGLETPELQRQSRDFGGAVKAAGKPVRLLVGEGFNHFEIIEGASLKAPTGLFNASLDGNVRRAIDIHERKDVDKSAFKALILEAVTFNATSKSKASTKSKS